MTRKRQPSGMFPRRLSILAGLCLSSFLAATPILWSPVSSAATPQLCTGGTHSMALRSDGRVFAWGWDGYGQVGQGRLLFRASAAPVTSLTGIRSVSSRFGGQVLAVATDGRLYAWGSNDEGQAGDGTVAYHGNDVILARVSDVSSASAGGGYSLAVTRSGAVWSWGDNSRGGLGDGTTTSRPMPAPISGLSNIASVSAATWHALAVRQDGTVWAWGGNTYGELGNGTSSASYRPAQVPGLSGVAAVSAANGWSVALKSDGTVWAWGRNDLGQLGTSSPSTRPTPAQVPGLSGMVAVSAMGAHGLALKSDGTVWAWGYNSWGQLGQGAGTAGATPRTATMVPGLAGVAFVSAGDQYSLAVRSDGTVYGWGYNVWGEVGVDPAVYPYVESPTLVPGISGATEVSAGFEVSFAVSRGTVLGWGKNNYQQLASGTAKPVNQTTPALVADLDGVTSIACGMFASYAVRSDGSLWAWGYNEWAAIGDGTFVSRSSPVRVTGVPAIASVSAAYSSNAGMDEPHHVLALDRTGRVWAWGANLTGQLGTGGTSSSRTPVALASLPTIAAVSAGAYHSLALDTQGRIWAWGSNSNGQLGDGTTTLRRSPVLVSGLASVSQVSAGWDFSLAATTAGRAWAWGSPYAGELGTGGTSDQLVPALITSLSDVRFVSAGSDQGLAILGDGTLWAWGSNEVGQLGDGTLNDRARPVRVSPAGRTLSAVAGNGFSMSSITGGGALAWGLNFNGQLGDGTLANRVLPQLVVGENGSGQFNLYPGTPLQIPSDKLVAFPLVAAGSATTSAANVSAVVNYRSQDVGTTASTFIFALAPSTIVKDAPDGSAPFVVGKAVPATGEKADVACVLAQLNSAGQLQAVSASSIQAYVTGVLSAQGQAVTVINGVPTANIGGATFYVGYGTSSSAMLNGGLNRSVVSVPGARECKPQAPQTGWWWNANEGGRGYSIEAAGNNLFMASYLYDVSGRATWHVAAGPTSLDGSVFSGALMSFGSGVTLGGPYRANARLPDAGSITLAFDDATHGTMVWPGGTVALTRYAFGTSGVDTPPLSGQPESGWWWGGTADNGRGFFIEWQGARAFIAGYMYDAQGNAIWYVADSPVAGTQTFTGTWLQFANGQTLTGAYRAPTLVNGNVAPVTIQFQGADTALLTLPYGTVPLTRFRF